MNLLTCPLVPSLDEVTVPQVPSLDEVTRPAGS